METLIIATKSLNKHTSWIYVEVKDGTVGWHCQGSVESHYKYKLYADLNAIVTYGGNPYKSFSFKKFIFHADGPQEPYFHYYFTEEGKDSILYLSHPWPDGSGFYPISRIRLARPQLLLREMEVLFTSTDNAPTLNSVVWGTHSPDYPLSNAKRAPTIESLLKITAGKLQLLNSPEISWDITLTNDQIESLHGDIAAAAKLIHENPATEILVSSYENLDITYVADTNEVSRGFLCFYLHKAPIGYIEIDSSTLQLTSIKKSELFISGIKRPALLP